MLFIDFKILCIDKDLNTITPEEWRALSANQRSEFHNYHRTQGNVSFVCINCGFPTYRGVASCEACKGAKI